MGADVYLKNLHNEVKAEYGPLFTEAVRKRDAVIVQKERSLGYRVGIDDPDIAPLQEEVSKYFDLMNSEGYFRDSYNNSSLLWTLGLSWWQDVTPMLNKKGEMSITKTKQFLKMIEDRPVTMEIVVKQLAELESLDSAEDWFAYWKEKRENLIELLKKSIELKEPMYFSL